MGTLSAAVIAFSSKPLKLLVREPKTNSIKVKPNPDAVRRMK